MKGRNHGSRVLRQREAIRRIICAIIHHYAFLMNAASAIRCNGRQTIILASMIARHTQLAYSDLKIID